LPIEGRVNMAKSIRDDVSVPIATTRESADDMGEESGSCRSIYGRVPVCHGGDSFMFSLVV